MAPRRLTLGLDVNAAQSNGECPGSRTTLREEFRAAGARVLLVGLLLGGTRKDDALDGGGRREGPEFGLGGAKKEPWDD